MPIGEIPFGMVEAALFVVVLQQVRLEADTAEHVAKCLIRVKDFVIVGTRPGSAWSDQFLICGRRMIGIGNRDSEAPARPEILEALSGGSAAIGRCEVLPNVFGQNGIEAMLAEGTLPIGVVEQVKILLVGGYPAWVKFGESGPNDDPYRFALRGCLSDTALQMARSECRTNDVPGPLQGMKQWRHLLNGELHSRL
jgi:hypothetical protein